ncbi:MAG: bifunctional transaldolase/phosoglucose isomerase [Myxococcota bacterium]
MKPTLAVLDHRQSIWFDYIERRMIWDGTLLHMVEQEGLRGVTSNPSIFEKAMGGSPDYGPPMAAAVRTGASPSETFELLAVEDIQWACDVFRSVYEDSQGRNGFVSLEVSPHLAYETLETIEEAHRLWESVARDNLMIKVPGTEPGLVAIEQLLSDGININITLLFSVQRYQKVLEAYLRAMERRCGSGLPIDAIASVASFFVSRIDGAVDPKLEAHRELRGKTAIANARAAYRHFQSVHASDRVKKLEALGMMRQRLLWASTSTKNPDYPDTMYVDELIGPDTVNTVPAETYKAFNDHGTVETRLDQDPASVLNAVATAGIDLESVCEDLEQQGVKLFADAYDRLMAAVQERRLSLLNGATPRATYRLGSLEKRVEEILQKMDDERVVRRLWDRDGTLFSDDDASVQEHAASFMGWLDAIEDMEGELEHFDDLQEDLAEAGVETVVLMGMGGSSLAPDVFSRCLGPLDESPELVVLDSTHPHAVKHILELTEESEASYIVASKSGSTAEPVAFHTTLFHHAEADEDDELVPGDRFMAITDPGSSLERQAFEQDFTAVYNGDPEVGGRFSALSPFGLVPASAMGLDVGDLLARARLMVGSCGPEVPARANEGARLGATLGAAAEVGRNKLTLVTSPALGPFGGWLEQLVAESTGKGGKGILPIDGEEVLAPDRYGDDRIFVSLRLAEEERPAGLGGLESAGHPVVDIELPESADLVQEMFRWEVATALAGYVMRLNPFDQPNVQESKEITQSLLREAAEGHAPKASDVEEIARNETILIERPANAPGDAGEVQEVLLRAVRETPSPGYVAMNAFLHMTGEAQEALQTLRREIRRFTRAATTVGFGPRFLHSTGQLHKGGPEQALFLHFWDEPTDDVEIPGRPYGFRTMLRAQELGDFQALARRGRNILRIGLGPDPVSSLHRLAELLRATSTA